MRTQIGNQIENPEEEKEEMAESVVRAIMETLGNRRMSARVRRAIQYFNAHPEEIPHLLRGEYKIKETYDAKFLERHPKGIKRIGAIIGGTGNWLPTENGNWINKLVILYREQP